MRRVTEKNICSMTFLEVATLVFYDYYYSLPFLVAGSWPGILKTLRCMVNMNCDMLHI